MRSRAATARHATIGCLAALALVLSVEIFGTEGPALGTRAVVWTIGIVPLALFLPGLVRGSSKSFQWLCFVACVYFFAIMSRPAGSMLHWISLLLVVALFVSAMMYSRWRQRELAVSTGRAATGETDANG